MLHEVVATHGYVADDDVLVVAEVLNLSRADVHGVVTFYPTCAALPRSRTGSRCAAARPARRGAPRGCTPRPPTAGPAPADVEVGEVFCLGLCAVGPSGTVDGTLHAALSPERLDALDAGVAR